MAAQGEDKERSQLRQHGEFWHVNTVYTYTLYIYNIIYIYTDAT